MAAAREWRGQGTRTQPNVEAAAAAWLQRRVDEVLLRL
jgi:hypothetical protein